MAERRLYSRVLYKMQASLKLNNQVLNTEIIDLSLNGVLLTLPSTGINNVVQGEIYELQIANQDLIIKMNVELVHENHEQLGFIIKELDLESASQLKRLVELNIGNDDLLHRELAQLIGK